MGGKAKKGRDASETLAPSADDVAELTAYARGKRDGAKEALERVVAALRSSTFADGLMQVVLATRLEDLLEKSLAPRTAGTRKR